jgi:peptidoglycan biosynthesis protein MviN/MurJ (putative lipid II flippase)
MVTLLVMSTELATVLMVLEQGRYVAKVNAIALVLGLMVSFAGGKMIGITGVALGATVGEITSRFLNYRYAARLLRIPTSQLQDWGTLARIVLAAIIAGAISGLLVSDLYQYSDFIILCSGATAFGIAYLLLLWILRLGWLLRAMSDRGKWR